ncbi:hypothetical protein J6590_018254 [Homalodisca vitripennis]|nr:hypothetical protein J6590_018254 [Homalodisca vitripennis]
MATWRRNVISNGSGYTVISTASCSRKDALETIPTGRDVTVVAIVATLSVTNHHRACSDRGNAFAHGVWYSLADYPLNPLRATEGPGRNPFG